MLVPSALALAVACGSDSTPLCEDTSWFDGREPSQARLTGAPRLSSSEIRRGDPLTVFVPVNEKAREVHVRIALAGDGEQRTATDFVETEGGETVELSVENTNLSPGVYVADSVTMWGEIAPDFGGYEVGDASLRYQFWTSFGTDSPGVRCVTEIAAPTFVVVADGATTSGE